MLIDTAQHVPELQDGTIATVLSENIDNHARRWLVGISAVMMACAVVLVHSTQEPADFFVEIEPSGPAYFFGGFVRVSVFWSGGDDPTIEVLADDKVITSSLVAVPGPRTAYRDGKRYLGATLSVSIDDRFAPGVIYRARAKSRSVTSALSGPFTIEPWGSATADGIQASLVAPVAIARGEPLVVTIRLRNTKNVPVLVPSGDAPRECSEPWLNFAVFEPASRSTGRGLRDDRKSCGHPPTMSLERGQTVSYKIDLGQLNEHGDMPRRPFRAGAGPIRMRVTYRARLIIGGEEPGVWTGAAVSNPVTIEIK